MDLTLQLLEFTWWDDIYVRPWKVPYPNTQLLALLVSGIVWIRHDYLAQVKSQRTTWKF